MATAPDRLQIHRADGPAMSLRRWVAAGRRAHAPEGIHWCDGSDGGDTRELQRSHARAPANCMPLNAETHFPAATCTARIRATSRASSTSPSSAPEHEEDAGPNNHWMAPAEAHAKMDALFEGCMRGRTMYVIPYCMGPIDSPYCALRRRDHGQRLRRGEHEADDAHGRRRARAHRAATAASSAACIRSASSIRSAASSCISRKSSRSRASARAMAATRCSARNAMRCASRAGRRARKAGSPSTC